MDKLQRRCGCSQRQENEVSSNGRRTVLTGAMALALSPLAASAADPAKARAQAGDLLVYTQGDQQGQVVKVDDLKVGEAPQFVFPMDPATKTVRDGLRVNQAIVVRLDASKLGSSTKPHAVDGVVAYSAICTHYGCLITTTHEDGNAVVCNCHGSTFDAGNNGAILIGPAERRLALLPLKSVDGAIVVAAGFNGRIGPPQA